jgi:hypothetical protein
MKTERDRKVKTPKSKLPTKMEHRLQLRLSTETVADIDYMIATVPQLSDFTRSGFLVAAVRYALDSLREEGYDRDRRAAGRSVRH